MKTNKQTNKHDQEAAWYGGNGITIEQPRLVTILYLSCVSITGSIVI